jgi:hypothetical protein
MPKKLKDIRRDLRGLPSSRYSPTIDPRKYPKLKVSKIATRPAPGVRTLNFKGIVKSEGTSDKSLSNYLVQVQFYGVAFTKEKKEGYIPIKIGSALWYYRTPTVRTNPVALKCQCEAYRFYFEKWMYDNRANIGNYRRYNAKKIDKENGVDTGGETYYTLGPGYVRKTPAPPDGRPYLNPDGLMGYCKHLHNFLMALKNGKLIGE